MLLRQRFVCGVLDGGVAWTDGRRGRTVDVEGSDALSAVQATWACFPGVLVFFLGSSFGLRVRLVETTGQIRNGACCADNTRYTQISRTKKQSEVFILGGRQS